MRRLCHLTIKLPIKASGHEVRPFGSIDGRMARVVASLTRSRAP